MIKEKSSISDVMASVDAMNVDDFVNFLDEGCCFRFGNLPAVAGIDAIRKFVGSFFDSIDSLQHDISDYWTITGGVVCHGTVSYTRHDKSVLTVPFSNIFKINDDKIFEYLIFADTSQLYSQ